MRKLAPNLLSGAGSAVFYLRKRRLVSAVVLPQEDQQPRHRLDERRDGGAEEANDQLRPAEVHAPPEAAAAQKHTREVRPHVLS